MPIPRHSVALPNVQLAAQAETGGVTELRVHGVGGTPPDAILGDLAPEQVMGDAIAGFYRSSVTPPVSACAASCTLGNATECRGIGISDLRPEGR